MSDFTPNQRVVLAAIGGGLLGGAVVAWLVGAFDPGALVEGAGWLALIWAGMFVGFALVVVLVAWPLKASLHVAVWLVDRIVRWRGRALLLLAVALAGCAPATSVVSDHIPTRAPSSMSTARAVTNRTACDAEAKPGMDHRRLTYAACMIARGHTAFVRIGEHEALAGGGALQVDVTATAPPKPQRQTFEDLVTCTGVAERASSGAAKAAGFLGIIGVPLVYANIAAMENALRPCLEQRGYTVTPWIPEPSSVAPAGVSPGRY